MKTRACLLAAFGLFVAGSLARADDTPPVPPPAPPPAPPVQTPAVRRDSLAMAEALLSQKPIGLPAGVADPFHSDAFAEATGHVIHGPSNPDTGTAKAGPRTERAILAGIAKGLNPSGNFVIGGQETLFFGQKRVKPGTVLTINFEGAEYIVEVTAIDRTNFTLRLNREEYTRPIK